ncbi:MAG: NTP transferase domain-containing protein [Verrucomicrobia bacterium]|nr:NTP transferase domain-containing protein [Verrucomicrobiota bacterium]
MERTRTIILAGGKGTRLRPLTTVFPKPLVPLGNKPVLEILLRRLAASGLVDVTICTGYLGELIQAVCGDGHKFGLKIEYVTEEEPLGTAGPLGLIRQLTDPLLVLNGDLLTTLDFRRIIQFHRETSANFTLAVFPREVKIDFGVIRLDPEGEFQGYLEKPSYHYEVSMGVNVISRKAVEHVRVGERLDMPDLVLRVNQCGGRVKCYRETCQWLDIGRMDDYARAQDEFCRNDTVYLEPPSAPSPLSFPLDEPGEDPDERVARPLPLLPLPAGCAT